MDEEELRAIGARLREFRVSTGSTQDSLAMDLGVTRQSVAKWEAGEAMPNCDRWLKLGRLGLSLDYVVLNIRNVPVSQYARDAVMEPP